MPLFNKKEKKEVPSLPELPLLPELPELPDIKDFESDEEISKLPSFPRNSYGNKFSRDTIKEAVMGEEEEIEDSADELNYPKNLMMQNPLQQNWNLNDKNKRVTREIDDNYEYKSSEFSKNSKIMPTEKGPIFVRLDKFEEAQTIFKETKENLREISNLLEETKDIKQKEEKTIQEWETELQNIKNRIEKVDRDIFSKI
ncbi:MAG: hypothetical protein WC812_00205 [Candidatus Pacearchaeota archaeon]|jgi:hypothetical protein